MNKSYQLKSQGMHFLDKVNIPVEALVSDAEEKRIADFFIHAINTCHLLSGILEQMEGTPYHRHQLKATLNRFLPELLKVGHEKLAELSDANHHDVLFNMLDEQEELMKEISRHQSNEYAVLRGIFQMYRENPRFVLDSLDIHIVDSQIDTTKK